MEPTIVFSQHPDESVLQFIREGVDLHVVAETGLAEWTPANFLLHGSRGEVVGGLIGIAWGGYLHVRYLWVTDSLRGRGHGGRLLRAAEDFARERGCSGATLETFSFQARPFYEKQGYCVVGSIDGFPPGHTKYFLQKNL